MSWGVNSTNPLASSLSGTQNAARVTKAANEKAKAKPAPSRPERRDEYDHVEEAGEVEHADAVRSLKDNSQEEAHEDRREHGTEKLASGEGRDAERKDPSERGLYRPDASVRPAASRSSRSLDLRG